MSVIRLDRARIRHHIRLEESARCAFIDRELDRALELGRAAIRLGPDCGQGFILVGDILSARGAQAEALAAYHQARKLSPDRAEAYWSISTVHFLRGGWRNALHFLNHAQQRLRRGDGPLYQWIAEDRAVALLRLGRIPEALEAVRWGLRRRPASDVRLRQIRREIQAAGRLRLTQPPARRGKLIILPRA